MALLMIDGFDHIGTGSDLYLKWPNNLGGGSGAQTTTVRTGTHALSLNFLATIGSIDLPVSGAVAIVGFAFRLASFQTSNRDLLTIWQDVTAAHAQN